MSMFLCAKCDELRDSDGGCAADDDGSGLKCMVCINEEPDYEPGRGEFTPAQQAIIDAYEAEGDGEGP